MSEPPSGSYQAACLLARPALATSPDSMAVSAKRVSRSRHTRPSCRVTTEGSGVHFIHERGKGDHPLPLILTHGYPGFIYAVSEDRADADRSGRYTAADPADAFDVVIPSLSGLRVLRQTRDGGFHVPHRRSLARADDRDVRLRTLRRARRRLGQHGHRTTRPQSCAIARRHSPDGCPLLASSSRSRTICHRPNRRYFAKIDKWQTDRWRLRDERRACARESSFARCGLAAAAIP